MRLMLKLAAAFHLTIVHNRITKQIIMKTPWSVAPFNVEKPEIHMKWNFSFVVIHQIQISAYFHLPLPLFIFQLQIDCATFKPFVFRNIGKAKQVQNYKNVTILKNESQLLLNELELVTFSLIHTLTTLQCLDFITFSPRYFISHFDASLTIMFFDWCFMWNSKEMAIQYFRKAKRVNKNNVPFVFNCAKSNTQYDERKPSILAAPGHKMCVLLKSPFCTRLLGSSSWKSYFLKIVFKGVTHVSPWKWKLC